MKTKLIWITPNAEQVISDCARVSNPANQGKDGTLLMKYLRNHQHWSPFEMASACFEIETTRDIARQILRHRSFSFQEFSQRYAAVEDMEFEYRDARMQDHKNRQNSIVTDDENLKKEWMYEQDKIVAVCVEAYQAALRAGIAKEVARVVLPEGMTPSRMYMSGTIRSWIHYCDLRMGNGTQLEHQKIANQIFHQLQDVMPNVFFCESPCCED